MTDEPFTEGGPVTQPVFVEPDHIDVPYFITDYRRHASEGILREAAHWYGGADVTDEYGSDVSRGQ